jgi:hypothetical protein
MDYSISLHGQTESLFRHDIGNDLARDMASNKLKAGIFNADFPDIDARDPVTGEEIHMNAVTPEQAPAFMSTMFKLVPQPITQFWLDAVTGLRTSSMFKGMTARYNQYCDTAAKLGKFRLHLWTENIPKQFVMGFGNARMHDLVTYMRLRGTRNFSELSNLIKQYGVPEGTSPEKFLAQRVIDDSKINSEEWLPKKLGQVSKTKYTPEMVTDMAAKIAAG